MNNTTLIAVTIIICGGIVAGAVILGGNHGAAIPQQAHQAMAANSQEPFRPLSDSDFLYGNKDAKVTIVEFSDYECPFCGRLHPTLKELVDSRPEDVNWVYRDFPVHKEAWNTSYAATCVGKIAGNEAFWEYSNTMFANQRKFDQEYYEEVAQGFGVSPTDLQTCMALDETKQIVADHFAEAQRSGGRGTPHSVIITASGQFSPASGALPIETLHQIVDQALVN
jgi:protein-disulfide isomerase